MTLEGNNSAALTLGPHFEAEDLLAYALELLTPEERAAVEAHLDGGQGCAHCRQELAAVREEMGVYAVASIEATAMESAPAESRERLLAELQRANSEAPSAESSATKGVSRLGASPVRPAGELVSGGRPAHRSAAWKLAPWLGWGIAAATAFLAVHFYQDREAMRGYLSAQAGQIAQLSGDQARARQVVDALTDRSAQRVTLTLTKSPAPVEPSGRATYLANKGTLIFLASHLEQLPAGKTYELWVIPVSGAAPVPAGTFRPDAQGNANVVTAKLAGTGTAKAIGVTIEASGGSTTPTMPILLAGS